jgi:hypothetical protein
MERIIVPTWAGSVAGVKINTCKVHETVYDIWEQSINVVTSWALVTHTCNPSFLRGWDWENCSLRPMWANSLRPHLQNNQRKMD